MIKTFQIDFIRAILDWQIQRDYNEDIDNNFSKSEVNLFSFYEHLVGQNEVNRFVERYNQLVEQQNRQNQIGFGIVAITDNPNIMNLRDSFISPFEWSCNIRTTMANRDKMLSTIYNVIFKLKGKKVDVACLHCRNENGEIAQKLLPLGHITDTLHSGDFIGVCSNSTQVANRVSEITDMGISCDLVDNFIVYSEKVALPNNKLCRWKYDLNEGIWLEDNEIEYDFDDNETIDSIIYNVPEHISFEKMKVSLSFDDIVCDEPYSLNAQEFCQITFGGSATLCDANKRVGNDLVRVFIGKEKIVASNDGENDIDLRVNGEVDYADLDPIENPSSLSSNNELNHLRSNFFQANSNTDSITNTLQYTFALDMSIPLLKQWYRYARYYDTNRGANGEITTNSITPNMVYSIKEIWSSWGNVEINVVSAKLGDSIDLDNTESDIMTIQTTFQLQGGHN